MYEHLLVPVDGSELSHKAMTHAIGLAKMLGASITRSEERRVGKECRL